jgi:transcriptional regulator with GAF, ATPase, and Fis domain
MKSTSAIAEWNATAPEQTSSAHRYRALVQLSETLWTHCHRAELLSAIAHELPLAIESSFLGIALYNFEADRLETYVPDEHHRTWAPGFDGQEVLSRWVFEHQEAVVIPNVHDEERFPQTIQYFATHSVESVWACPLTTAHHRLGCLIVGRPDARAFNRDDLAVMTAFANQVAFALDHVFEFEAMRALIGRERARADSLDTSDELLRTISDVLDIRQIFPRISEIAAKVLPHDSLMMTFHDGKGEVIIEAASEETPQKIDRLRCGNPGRVVGDSFLLIDDLSIQTFDVVDPPDFWDAVRANGYRSLLLVGVKARDQQLGLLFWSKRPRAFPGRDVPIARRIADHVALAVSHQHLADAARRISEARTRADVLEARVKSLSEELDARTGYRRVIGRSLAWQAVLKAATQVAATDTTVSLTGESGTGKEVVARFIHRASNRQNGPFVALNCAALPEQLLESELFGYERGAFTGAQHAKAGLLESATGGVLFLDEVSEMSLSAQAKFLRVLQEREFQRLGSTRVIKANVRVIAATNRDLKKAVDRKEFREDLFYRLQVFDIKLPPLRARVDDILPLSGAFLQDIGRTFGRPPAGLTRDAKQALLRYRWPGNVRELRNALERAAILCEGGLITAEHLSLHDDEQRAPASGMAQSSNLSVIERETIERVLRECQGNKSRTARQLGLTRTQLYHRLSKYQLALGDQSPGRCETMSPGLSE